MATLPYDLDKMRAAGPRLSSWFSQTPTVDQAFGTPLTGDRPVYEGVRISGSLELRAPANGFVRYGSALVDPQPSSTTPARDPVFDGLKGLRGEPFRPWSGDAGELAHALQFEVFPHAWLRVNWMFQWLDQQGDPTEGQGHPMRPVPHRFVLVPSDPDDFAPLFSSSHVEFAHGTTFPTFPELGADEQVSSAAQRYVDAGTVLGKLAGSAVNLFVFDRHGWPMDPAYAVHAWKLITTQFEGSTLEDDDLDRQLHEGGSTQLWVHEVGRSATPPPGWVRAALRVGAEELVGQGSHPVRKLTGFTVGTEATPAFDTDARNTLREKGAVPILAAPEREKPTSIKLLERDFLRLHLDDQRMVLDPGPKLDANLESIAIPEEDDALYEGEVVDLHPLPAVEPVVYNTGRAVHDALAEALSGLTAPAQGEGRVDLVSSEIDPRALLKGVRERLELPETQEWTEAHQSWLSDAQDRLEARPVRRGDANHLLLMGAEGDLPEGAALFAWRLGMDLETQRIQRHPAIGRWVTATGRPVLLVELPSSADEVLVDLMVVVWEDGEPVVRDTLTLTYLAPAESSPSQVEVQVEAGQVELTWPADAGITWVVRPSRGAVQTATGASITLTDLSAHEAVLVGHGDSLEDASSFRWVDVGVALMSAVPTSLDGSLGEALLAIPDTFQTHVGVQAVDPLLEAIEPSTVGSSLTGLAQRRLEHGLFVRGESDQALVTTAPLVPEAIGTGPGPIPNLEVPDHGEPVVHGVALTGRAAFEVHRALGDRTGGPVWERVLAAADDELLKEPETTPDVDLPAVSVLRTLPPGQFGAAFGPDDWPTAAQLDDVQQWVNDVLQQLDPALQQTGQETATSLAQQGEEAAERVKRELLRMQELDKEGRRDGIEVLVRMIGTAHSLVYIETEHFDAYRLNEDDEWDPQALNLAQMLHLALVARPDLRVVICVPEAIEHPLGGFAETALAYSRRWAVQTLRYGAWGDVVELASQFTDGDTLEAPGTLRRSRFADGLLPAQRALVVHPENGRGIPWAIHGTTVVVDDEQIWMSSGGLSRRAQTYHSGLAVAWSGVERTQGGVRAVREHVRQRLAALTGLSQPWTAWLERPLELFRTLSALADAGRLERLQPQRSKVHAPTSSWTLDGPPQAALALVDPAGDSTLATLLKLFSDDVDVPGHEVTVSFTHSLADTVQFVLHLDRVIAGVRHRSAVEVEASPVTLRGVPDGIYEVRIEALENDASVAQASETVTVEGDEELQLSL